MKPRNLLLLGALLTIGLTTVHAQVNYAGDVLDEVTEFTHTEKGLQQSLSTHTASSEYDVEERSLENKVESDDTLKHWIGDPAVPVFLQRKSRVAISENVALPGPESNIATQQTSKLVVDQVDNTAVQTEVEQPIALTPKQVRASNRLAKVNARAAANLAKKDAVEAIALIPKNSVYNDSKFKLYAQLGLQDQKVGGLNLMLASKHYPAVGAYSYRAEFGSLYQLSEDNTLDIGLRYELMNGLDNSQRFDRPSAGQVTTSNSTMWLAGFQTGIDHNFLPASEWTLSVGLGLGFDFGGLHLKERVEDMAISPSPDPSIPTPDEVAVVHYNLASVHVTPRLTLRSPELANGWHFQVRAGYQFGKNTMFRVDEYTSVKDDLVYNPSGLSATVGIVAPLPKMFCKQAH